MDIERLIVLVLFGILHWVLAIMLLSDLVKRKRVLGGRKAPWAIAIILITFSVIFSVGTNWVLWAGIMLIISKLFGEELGKWNVFFIIIGYAFIASVVYTLLSAVIFTSLPVLKMPLNTDLQVAAFTKNWLPNLAYQIGTIILWAGEVWIAALSTIVIRLMKNINWGKAATISAVAFGLRFVLRFFFGL